MSNRLSHSQIKLFSDCQMKWKFSYVDRLRERTKGSALLFGTAFDKAIEAVLKDKSIDEYKIFDEVFANQEINKRMVHIPDSLLAIYSNADLDQDLLLPEDWKFLATKADELIPNEEGDSGELVHKCLSYKKQRSHRFFEDGERKFLNLASWLSLRRKGHLMLRENRHTVMPLIKEVLGAQVEIKLENGEGDTVIGYADLVCKLHGHDETFVIDYKTSTIDYLEDSARTSSQLGTYAHSLDLTKVGYFVFKKKIIKNRTKICSACGFDGGTSGMKTCHNLIEGKRCGQPWIETLKPSVDVQVILDEISQETSEAITDNIEEVNRVINEGIFVRNLATCNMPWGRCPYFNTCHENGDEDDLEVV